MVLLFTHPSHPIAPRWFLSGSYNNWLLDFPTLLDACALYKDANPALVRQLLESLFTMQPKYRAEVAKGSAAAAQNFLALASRCEEVVTA